MAAEDRYQVDTTRDDPQNLKEVLENIATRPDHIRIVSVTWQPDRARPRRRQDLWRIQHCFRTQGVMTLLAQ